MEGYYLVGSIALVSLLGMLCIVMDIMYPSDVEEVVIPKKKPIVFENSILSNDNDSFADTYIDDPIEYTE
jgi:hypothetical protein